MDIKNVDFLFSENPNPMWIYDPSDLSIKGANKSALTLYGYTEEEVLSMSIADLRPESEIAGMKEQVSKSVNDFNDIGIWKHQKKNGDTLFVRILSNPISYQGRKYKLVAVHDVTNKLMYKQELQMLLENSLDGIMLSNPNGSIYRANKAACEILGMDESEIIKRGRDGLVCKDQKLKKALEKRIVTGHFAGELTFIHKSGRKIPVELSSSIYTNHCGEKRSSLVFRDISSRLETEKALKQEKNFTEVALNSLPGVFFVLDDTGKVIRWNENSKKVFGMTDDEINGSPAADFVHEDDRERVQEEILRVFEEGHTMVEFKLKTANNSISVYKFVANRFYQDGRIFIVGSAVDITQQKEMEAQITSMLREEHKQRREAEIDRDKLQNIYEMTPSPKCFLEGREFRYTIANKSYRELVGQEDIVGKKVMDVVPEIAKQGFIDILNQVYETGESYIGHEVPILINKCGKEEKQDYILNLAFQPVFGENDTVEGIFVEAVDVSDQLAYQQQLESSLTEKETLLGEIHHRVKNNLAVISSMLELQAMDSSNLELRNLLTASQQRIKSIALIHEVLYQSKDLSQVNFKENVKRLIENLSQVYDVEGLITIAIESDAVTLNINQAIPCALIINEIVTNAYKHAFRENENGHISIVMSERYGDLKIQISDNGVGLPEDFNQDTTTSLGMTLIKSLKQQLEADLTINRIKGTEFVLKFEKAEIRGSASTLVA